MEHETIHTQKMKADFPFFGIVSGIYAVFYTFCMYRNASGITLPFLPQEVSCFASYVCEG